LVFCTLIEGNGKRCHRTALKTQSTASNHIKSSPGKGDGKGQAHNAYAMWCSDVVGIGNKRMQSICQRLCPGVGDVDPTTRPSICMYVMSAFRP